MKIVKNNIDGFSAFVEKHKSGYKRRLKTKNELEKEIDKAEKEKIQKGIENIENNVAHETNKLCS